MKKILRIGLSICFAMTLFYSCSTNSNNNNPQVNNTNYTAAENFNYYVGINNQKTFILDGINGAITITPTEDIAATISGERKVQSENVEDATESLKYLKVIVEESGDEVNVHTQQPSNTGGRIFTVTYNLELPVTWAVDITNVNGALRIDSLQSTIHAVITNGDVTLNSINTNTVTASVVNGNITLNEVAASPNINLVNGYINGNVILPASGLCNMNITNGTINLQIPKNTNAQMEAKVVNGSVGVLNLSMQNVTSSSTFIQGTLGSGDGTIDLNVVNGSINVSGYQAP